MNYSVSTILAKPFLNVSKIKANGQPSLDQISVEILGNELLSGNVDIETAVHELLKRHNINNVRHDAVIANVIKLTITNGWLYKSENSAELDEHKITILKSEALSLLYKTFGSRCVHASLDMNSEPIIIAVIIPLVKSESGFKLSSKEMFGPRQISELHQQWEDRLIDHGISASESLRVAKRINLSKAYGLLDDADQFKEEIRLLHTASASARLKIAERSLSKADQVNKPDTQKTILSIATELTKEQINKLRLIPIQSVALKLGHSGTIEKNENAIDLTKRLNDMSYKESVNWLYENFGDDAAKVSNTAIKNCAFNNLSKSDYVKFKAVEEQLHALSAAAYRITAMSVRDGEKIGQNIGKKHLDKDALSAHEIFELIPVMSKLNLQGWNLFITPLDKNIEYILIDDLNCSTMNEFKSVGYSPCIELQTSEDSFQAVVKIAKSNSDVKCRNQLFKDLNRAYGDEKIVGMIHPMRLAGFLNRKDKHRTENGLYPFVKIISAKNRLCNMTMQLASSYFAA
ncbi:DNA-primase RepB domain-containing protein [Paenochrobactrum pullorum]|uniref:DNA-primase RepB domain-containing protein n=1 Tax=Paenochrobactrum pullorum TaxID=1324351 RepID=UPI0035BBB9A8